MVSKMKINTKCNLINCLIVMDLVKTEDSRAMYDILDINSRKKITTEMLYNDLVDSGTRVMIEEREIYSKIYTFDRHKDCKFNDYYGPCIDDVDFSIMLQKDIWSYIYGEYFYNNHISSEIIGFGLIRL